MKGLVLSLFPGIGLLDMAFEEEGFCVVRGPDVLWGGDVRKFHPPAGRFDGVIGGPPCQSFSSLVHLVRANGHEPKFGNLIPEYERIVAEADVAWFVMEEVRGAPVPVVPGYATKDFLWNNAWTCGEDGYGQEQERLRRFTFGLKGERAVDLRRWLTPAALMLMERGCAAVGSPVCAHNGKGDPGKRSSRQGTLTQWTPDNSKERKRAVLSTAREVPVAIGGSGKVKRTRAMFGDGRPTRREHRQQAVTSSDGGASVRMQRYTLADACRLQGLPEDFLEHAPFTASGKLKAVANGVPLAMGRAIAKAVAKACPN